MAWKEIKYNSFIFSIFSGLPDTFAEYIDLDIIFEYQRLLLEMHSESEMWHGVMPSTTKTRNFLNARNMRAWIAIASLPNRAGVLICLTFQVAAHPSAVSFRWFFNNSEHQEWKDHADFSQSGLKSQIEFLPRTSKDYGNLYCIAENAIGVQSQPCSFQIVPTGET